MKHKKVQNYCIRLGTSTGNICFILVGPSEYYYHSYSSPEGVDAEQAFRVSKVEISFFIKIVGFTISNIGHRPVFGTVSYQFL